MTTSDKTIEFTCGCSVTFLGASQHLTSRLDSCEFHGSADKLADRNRIMEVARREVDEPK